MSKVIAYCRISSTVQDLQVQKQMLLEYAQRNKIMIDEFIESSVSSRLSLKERRVDELLGKLTKGDTLLVAELSRLGRCMLEVITLITDLAKNEIQVVFVRQPELSTTAGHGKLLLTIYAFFAETERDFISQRTKSGLATARAKGKLLGRPHGAKNLNGSAFDAYKSELKKHLLLKIPVKSILKIINSERETKLSYTALRYYIEHNPELKLLI